jgi:hypothetical protein
VDNPIVTVTEGQYGDREGGFGKLMVQGLTSGDAFEFYVNGEATGLTTTFTPGAQNQFDLSLETDDQQSGGGGGGGIAGGGGGGGSAPSVTTYRFGLTLLGQRMEFSMDSSGRFTEDVTFTASNGKITVYIPAGTLAKDALGNPLAELIIQDSESAPASPTGQNILEMAFSFLPDDVTFDPSITVYFSYEDSQLPAGVHEEDLSVGYYDPETETWLEFPSTVNTSDNVVEASISHLCYIAILYPRASASSSSSITGSDTTVGTGGDSKTVEGQTAVDTTSVTSAEAAATLSGESGQSQEPGTTSYLTWYIIGGAALVVIVVALGLAWKRARRYG